MKTLDRDVHGYQKTGLWAPECEDDDTEINTELIILYYNTPETMKGPK